MTKDKDGNSQKFWRPNSVYSYIQWKSLKPEFVVDISSSIDIKISAVECYKSQFYNPSSDEINTPISTKNFIKSVRYRAADLGRLTNLGYAEGFVSNQTLKVNSLKDLI